MDTYFAQREHSRNAHLRAGALTHQGRRTHNFAMASTLHIHLRAHRKARGLSQEHVANILGVKNNTLSGWETGARVLDLEDLEKLAKIYGIHPASLLLAPEEGERAEAMRAASELARAIPSGAVSAWLEAGKHMLPAELEDFSSRTAKK